MKVLMIDNYDSFTYNLVQYFGMLGSEVTIWRNDQFTLEDVRQLEPDAIVISPGPCTPLEAGLSVQVIREFAPTLPMLGVCLGHQAMGEAFGATVTRAKHVLHGKLSSLEHKGSDLFEGLEPGINVTRYHSLVVEDLPDALEGVAFVTETDGSSTLMALKHRAFPMYGVQFHPESIATAGGMKMLENFLKIAETFGAKQSREQRAESLLNSSQS
jgi:anthranilate synthase component II